MATSIKWNTKLNDTEYFIEFSGMTFFGYVWLSVNWKKNKYLTIYRKDSGYWVVFNCGSAECMLNIEKDRKTCHIYQKESPDENPEVKIFPVFETVALNKKIRSGNSSFFTILVLSLINIPMVIFNSPISFPFSLFFPTLLISIGYGISDEVGGNAIIVAASIFFAVCCILFFFVLYFFSSKSIIVTWISFGLLIMDTLILSGTSILSGTLSFYIVDIVFHIWILWSVLQLGLAKNKLNAAITGRIPVFTDEIAFSGKYLEAVNG
ncbi:MAG: hypothetical protein ACYCYI_13110 [Saccharofermentanales bacterium]